MVRRLKKVKKSTWIQICTFAAVGIAVVMIAHWTALQHFSVFQELMEWVQVSRSNPLRVAAFYLLFILGVLIFPITMFPVVGGVLLPFWIALPLNLAAATVGGWLAFLISRVVGRKSIEPFLKGKVKSFDRITAAQGFRTVFLMRIIGIPPFVVANYALGLSRIRFHDFVLGTVSGMLPWMIFITYTAGSLWEAIVAGGEKGFFEALMEALRPLTIISLSVLSLVAINCLARRRKKVAVSCTQASSPALK